MNKSILVKCLVIFIIGLAIYFCSKSFFKNDFLALKETYARTVFLNYQESLNKALDLQHKITIFFQNPNEHFFSQVKDQWIEGRISYGQTEAFRFCNGPIDFFDEKSGKEGPESRLNSWPVNEAYIDYVRGKPKSGLINSDIVISKNKIVELNGKGNEMNVSVGYHAIEFLLWGQDFYEDGPGRRPITDYANIPANQKRRQYLLIISDLLIEDLQSLVQAWNPNIKNNFYHDFMKWSNKKFMSSILSSLATLSGFELASERMATALLSGDQEDEHSCFSDTTHNDLIANQQGIINVYFGKFKGEKGFGFIDYFAKKNPDFNAQIVSQLKISMQKLKNLPKPIDSILVSGVGSTKRQKFKQASDELMEQTNLFVKIGKVNNYAVIISGE